MILKRPPVFMSIGTSTASVMKIRPRNIIAMEDTFYYNEKVTIVTHTEGEFMTALTSQEIEKGMDALQEQYDEYNDFNFMQSGDNQ